MPRPQSETSLNAIRVLFQVSVVYAVGRPGIQGIIKTQSMSVSVLFKKALLIPNVFVAASSFRRLFCGKIRSENFFINKHEIEGNGMALIEFFCSNLTFKQQSSWIYLSAGSPMLVLSTLARIIT